jgi:hypothetical protein
MADDLRRKFRTLSMLTTLISDINRLAGIQRPNSTGHLQVQPTDPGPAQIDNEDEDQRNEKHCLERVMRALAVILVRNGDVIAVASSKPNPHNKNFMESGRDFIIFRNPVSNNGPPKDGNLQDHGGCTLVDPGKPHFTGGATQSWGYLCAIS